MKSAEQYIKLGMMAALDAFKKTLSLYPDGMTGDEISDIINEIDQQVGVKETEIQLLRA